MRVLFSGGGTLGPVTPLLAMWETIKQEYPEATAIWVGTKKGPERQLVEAQQMLFFTLPTGKLRRYLSPLNLIDAFRLVGAFFSALTLLIRERPDICISAGGFTSVPVHYAAWLLGIPTWIHQQDVVVGLSNKLMGPLATHVTTALEASTSAFSKKKTTWLGNPVRRDVLAGSRERGQQLFGLDPDVPTVFVTGGGTGSLRVNQLIVEAVQHLNGFAQVIHLTGKERPQELVNRAAKHHDYYQVHQFFGEEMKDAYAAADVVISRGGFGTISEVAALKKPAILIPKPGHQQQNVDFLLKHNAVIFVDETMSDGNQLAKKVRELIASKKNMEEYSTRIHNLMPPAKPADIRAIFSRVVR